MSEVKQSFGAWKNKTKDGKEVIKFTINGQRYNMWVNQYKEKNAQPDYKIYEDNWEPETAATTESPKPTVEKQTESLTPDDLPF